ncbi:hypothetical protein TYRP_008578 [Tyrophagus putrescentiae]|nr:hypothetical protein TYRP_008578 [Tyrophagus putrescentiae]
MNNFPARLQRVLSRRITREFNAARNFIEQMRRRFVNAHQGGVREAVQAQLNVHFNRLYNLLDLYKRNLVDLLVMRFTNNLANLPAFLAAPANPNDEFFTLDLNEINDGGAEEVDDPQHDRLMRYLRNRLVLLLRFIFGDLQNVFGNGAELRAEQEFHLDTANDILECIKAMADIIRPEFQVDDEGLEFQVDHEGQGPGGDAVGFD